MSIWARTLVYLGLREEDDDVVDWQVVEDAAPLDEVPARGGAGVRPSVTAGATAGAATAGAAVTATGGAAPAEDRSSNVRQLRTGLDLSSERVTVVHVRVFDDVETIGSRFRRSQPVLFDVSACSREVARRTVDFVSGLTYAGRGSLRRTAPRAFLLVPDGVDIALEERRRLSQLGYEIGSLGR